MPPAYVKPYVKRQKNDATDAEAICEAVTRANMRFVPTKTPEQQSCLMLHRTRHLFIRQQTAVINAIRAHLAEFGIVAPVGRKGVTELLHVVADPSDGRVRPHLIRPFGVAASRALPGAPGGAFSSGGAGGGRVACAASSAGAGRVGAALLAAAPVVRLRGSVFSLGGSGRAWGGGVRGFVGVGVVASAGLCRAVAGGRSVQHKRVCFADTSRKEFQ